MSESYNHELHSVMVRDLPGMAANLCRAMREFPINCAARDPSAGIQAFDTHWSEVIGNHVIPSGAPSMSTMLAALNAAFAMADFMVKYHDAIVNKVPMFDEEEHAALKLKFNTSFAAVDEGLTYTQAGYVFDQASVNSTHRDTIDLGNQTTGYDFYDLCRWLATKDVTGVAWIISSGCSLPSLDRNSIGFNSNQWTNFNRLLNIMYNGILPVFLDINHRIRDIAAIVKSDDDTPEFLDRAPWGIDTSKSGWTKLGNVTSPCVSFKLNDNARYQLLVKLPRIDDLKNGTSKVVRHVVLEHIDLGYIGSDAMFHGSELNTSCADNSPGQITYNILSDFFPITDTANTVVLKFADTGNTAQFSNGAVCTTDGKYVNSDHTGTYAFRPEWAEVYVRKVGKSVDKTIHATSFVAEDANDRKFTGATSNPLAVHPLVGPTVAPLISVTFAGFRTMSLNRPNTFYGTIYDGTEYTKSSFELRDIASTGIRFDVHYPSAGYRAGLKIRTKHPYVVVAIQMRRQDGAWVDINTSNLAIGKTDAITGDKFVSPLADNGLNPFIVDSDMAKPIYVNLGTCYNAAWPIRILVNHVGDKFFVTRQKLVTVGTDTYAPTVAPGQMASHAFVDTSIITLSDIIKLYGDNRTFQVRKSETEFDVVNANPFVYALTDNSSLVEATAKYAAEDLASAVFDELVWIKNTNV